MLCPEFSTLGFLLALDARLSALASSHAPKASTLDSLRSTRSPLVAQSIQLMKQSSVESGWSRAFRFERIEAWHLARAFNKAVYRAARGFPKEEMFALTSQIRRASVSISSNIAEGSGRNSDADFAHFLEVAYGSLMEVVSQLFIALDESYLAEPQFEALAEEADVLASKIVALSKALGRQPRIAGRQQSRAESGASRAQSSAGPRL